tara:strand:- start:96 stop:290 length:195 start_codon:yes stop_codon:yes gene_type:complete
MSYLKHLKKTEMNSEIRWIIKFNSNNKIKEVKQIFNPNEYKDLKNAKELLNKNQLIKILENAKS